MEKVAVVIPTLNGGEPLKRLLLALKIQTVPLKSVLIVDSQSNDDTVEHAKSVNFKVLQIEREQFNHGGTRQQCLELLPESDIVVFLTQDVQIADSHALENLVHCFSDTQVGAAYGRQLPHQNARPIEAHARLFNYPDKSITKSVDDIPKLGIKTVFCSNSFAAYRRQALMEVGGFPNNIIFGEDTYVAAKMVLAGWKVAYCAEAKVYHSHHYSYVSEFRRYFDIGVLHNRENWIQQHFGTAGGEGKRFVISEIKYLLRKAFWLIPSALLRSFLKLTAYKLGKMEKHIPSKIKKHLSMNRNYWNNN